MAEQSAAAEARTSCVHFGRAHLYDSRADRFAEANGAILDSFHKMFTPSKDTQQQQFIEVGCGTGSFTLRYLLPSLPPCRRLLAVDKSEAMLKLAKEKYCHPKIEYSQLDILDDVDEFVRQQGQFQRAYSFYTLHWIGDQRLAMRNIEKVMAPGGECLLLLLQSLPFFDLFDEMLKSPHWCKYSNLLQDYTPETHKIEDAVSLRKYVSELVSSTKLVSLSCEVFPAAIPEKGSKERAIEMLLSLNPVYPLITDEEKKELIKFTTSFAETLYTDNYDQKRRNRKLLVIHAFKPPL